MADPLISIITPTLNQAFSIRETIESVLEQPYSNFEYLIFDGGSYDGTIDILKEYKGESRLKWISERDRGQSHAINKGLAACKGDLFNWLNSDDLLEEDALGKLAEASARNQKFDILSGETVEFHHHSREAFNLTSLQLRKSVEESMTVGVFCQPSTFWRTQVVRDLGGLREDLHYAMDYDLWLRYLLAFGQNRVLKLNSILARCRHHKNSKTYLFSSLFYRDTNIVLDTLNFALAAPSSFLSKDYPFSVNFLRPPLLINKRFDRMRYFGSFCERRVRIERIQNPNEALRWLRKAFQYRPWISLWRLRTAWRLGLKWLYQ